MRSATDNGRAETPDWVAALGEQDSADACRGGLQVAEEQLVHVNSKPLQDAVSPPHVAPSVETPAAAHTHTAAMTTGDMDTGVCMPRQSLTEMSTAVHAQVQPAQAQEQQEQDQQDQQSAMTTFEVEVHGLASDEHVYLVGSDASLGQWQPQKGVRMEHTEPCASAPCATWRCCASLPLGEHVKYKYVVRCGEAGYGWRWEPGKDRSVVTPPQSEAGGSGARVQDRLVDTSAHRSICLGLCRTASDRQATQQQHAGDDQLAARQSQHSEEHALVVPQLHGSALSLVKETDKFLQEMGVDVHGAGAVGKTCGNPGTEGNPGKEVMKRTRFYVERCQSELEKVCLFKGVERRQGVRVGLVGRQSACC